MSSHPPKSLYTSVVSQYRSPSDAFIAFAMLGILLTIAAGDSPAWAGGPMSAPGGPVSSADRVGLADAMQTGIESITADELLEHVEILASDEFEGRKPGTAGGQKASDYIAGCFRSLNLQPAGDEGSYIQKFRGKFRNVLALLPATEMNENTEVIVVGAHFDHLGVRKKRGGMRSWLGAITGQSSDASSQNAPDSDVYNGADDNASGVSGILELAEAATELKIAPKRAILFALWDGEEMGLVGSRHWVDNPTIALDRVAFVMNLDMLGRLRDDHVIVWGAGSAPGLRRIVAEQNRQQGLYLDFRNKMITQSDHYPFFKEGIPVLFPWTGMHKQLHRPTDDVELINKQGMQQVTRLVHRIVWEMATRDEVPGFRDAARKEIQRNVRAPAGPIQAEPSDFVSSWGFSCRTRDAEPGKFVVSKVEDNSLAATANLSPKDRIYEIQGVPVGGTDELPESLATNELRCEVQVERDGKFLSLLLVPENEPSEIAAAEETASTTPSANRRTYTKRRRFLGKLQPRIERGRVLARFRSFH